MVIARNSEIVFGQILNHFINNLQFYAKSILINYLTLSVCSSVCPPFLYLLSQIIRRHYSIVK
jgi:hypothetical protein